MSRNRVNPLGMVMVLEFLLDDIMSDVVMTPACLEDHLLLSPDVPEGLEPPPIHSVEKGAILRCTDKGWRVECLDCQRLSCWLNDFDLTELWLAWHTYLIERTEKSVNE